MRNNWSRTLLRGQAKGAVVVASIGPEGVKGKPVIYAPRNPTDPYPWVPELFLRAGIPDHYRYTGRECHLREEQ